jgi:uracil-DNA glycosylase
VISSPGKQEVAESAAGSRTIDELTARVVECRACPRLVAWREQVAAEKRAAFRDETYWGRPVPGWGDPQARIVIVGLAPAAHGGNRTGRIFTGDRSGDWLYDALHRFGFASQPNSHHRDDGLKLSDCYIGATVRCAPPDNKPALEEFEACRPYLREELRSLRKVRVVVALGKIAFDHYLKVCRDEGLQLPSPIPKFSHGIVLVLPGGMTLIGSYHPSQRNTFTGLLTRPMFHHIFATARQRLAEPADK